jgi:hypothetical protein
MNCLRSEKTKFESSHILFLANYVQPATHAGNRLRPPDAPLRPDRTGFPALKKKRGSADYGVQLADAKN